MSERGYIDAAPGRRTAAGALLVGGYNPTKLWVGGLPDTATLADLEDCFGQIGPCSCNIKRGFGFVVSFRNFYLFTLLSLFRVAGLAFSSYGSSNTFSRSCLAQPITSVELTSKMDFSPFYFFPPCFS